MVFMDRDFMLEDVEILDFELDVAVKEVFPPLENLEVIPTKGEQTFNHESSYGYDEVVVKPIPDEYIIPEGLLPITENTTYDVRQYARVSASVHPAPVLQDKELTITENGTYVLRADEEYEGLNEVTVSTNAIEVLTEELETYNNELTEQETTINDIVQMLKDKGIGEKPKYAPKHISFKGYSVVNGNLDYELANLDTSNITDMTDMFNTCRYVTSLNVSHFNTSKVTKMDTMFYYCQRITTMDIGNWDAGKVTSISNMFGFCDLLEHVVLPQFSTYMQKPTQVFRGCSNLKTADVSGLVTDNASSFENMFASCYELTAIDVSHFNTSNVTYMANMFSSCRALTTLDLSNFNTEKVTNMNYMFSGCTSLIHLDIRNFDFTKVTSHTNIFNGIPVNCLIIVKDETAKSWVLARRSDLTNVKTVAEYEG